MSTNTHSNRKLIVNYEENNNKSQIHINANASKELIITANPKKQRKAVRSCMHVCVGGNKSRGTSGHNTSASHRK